ncbi:hypothetical protein [Pedobacter sp. BS3]|nr:hypothetical protein [Pedobacter sp. BS3]
MKKQVKLLYILSTALLLSACSKNLVETPKDAISPDQFLPLRRNAYKA